MTAELRDEDPTLKGYGDEELEALLAHYRRKALACDEKAALIARVLRVRKRRRVEAYVEARGVRNLRPAGRS